MKNTKNLLISLLVLAVAAGTGWAAYTYAGPSRSAEAAHAGHAHGEESADAHGHGHEDEDETDLDALFAAEDHHDEHAGHDHAAHEQPGRAAVRARDPHAGHGHGEGEICPEHQVAEAEDALCQPDGVASLRPGQGMKVRLSALETAERIGIAVARPSSAGVEGGAWPGQVVFNRDRLARLSALTGGAVRQVHVGLGEKVAKGQLLAEIAAPEAAGLRAELAAAESRRELAETVWRREKDLLEKGVTSRHEFQQAEAELRQAESAALRVRRQMRDFGLSDGDAGSVLPIRAPFAGVVTERNAVLGETVSAGAPLFALADLQTLWLEISIPENALLAVQPGMEMVASFAALPGRAFPGKIFWVAPALDERTRMLKVLAEVDNGEGLLRSGLFGQVRPAAKTSGETLAVPTDALQTVDGNAYLFLQLEDDLFELRRVTAGQRAQGAVIIREGLHTDDRVVVGQAFSLKSEVLRARLGASCADH
ncbi:MAG: efflux RND transporter periplasmic adaptor subunit [Desulfuromonadales bacterium]